MSSQLQSPTRVAVLLVFIALAVTAGSSVAQPALQPSAASHTASTSDETVALPDGRTLHLNCVGAGAPTVILDAGLGLDSSVWTRVQPQLGAISRTCAYDRAGYGQSDPGPLPRDADHRARDLLEMLDATSEKGPFVLVAHSAAERTARLAAVQRPETFAGLVLVDPGADLEALRAVGPSWAAAHDAGQAAALTCIRATAAGEMKPGNAMYTDCGSPPPDGPLASREMAIAVLSENEPEQPETVRGPTLGALGDLPIIVLTAQSKFGTNEGAEQAETRPLREVWSDAGARIAAQSTRGEQRIVPNASHVIQFEQPQAVIDAVRDLVETVRADQARAPVS